MNAQKIIEILGEWEGYRVSTVGSAPSDSSEVWIEWSRIKPLAGATGVNHWLQA